MQVKCPINPSKPLSIFTTIGREEVVLGEEGAGESGIDQGGLVPGHDPKSCGYNAKKEYE